MAEGENDLHTGRKTTGHEWNGIKELTTPVPKIVLFFLAVTFLVSLLIWVLAPTWPTGSAYTKGILGIDQRTSLETSLKRSAARTAPWRNEIEQSNFETIAQNTELMKTVRSHGARLFGDNCAMCHGADATGGIGFPSLVDDQWLWGGDPSTIMETLRVGINSTNDDTRISQMIAYGRDGILTLEQRRSVGAYVRSLSQSHEISTADIEKLEAGATIFAQQCASCHGPDGRGMQSVGAPNLTDDHWIYGGGSADIDETLRNGRHGVMPQWEKRTSATDRKILTLYILDLAEGAQ